MPEGTGRVIRFVEDLNPVEVRMLADRLAQKADFAAVFSGNDGEGYKYVMCSAHTDVAGPRKEVQRDAERPRRRKESHGAGLRYGGTRQRLKNSY